MPFSEDHAWPAGLQLMFDHARTKRAPFEQRYYGPYDKLLNYCFGDSFAFYVAPQSASRDDSRDVGDFNVSFVVCDHNDKPVLIVEAKGDNWAQKAELCYRVDKLMHNRYTFLLEECTLPRLWGLSLLGTSMRVYSGDTKSFEVTPARSFSW